MSQQPPFREHLDEIAAMREIKRAREMEDRHDRRTAFFEDPDYIGHANQNDRPVPEPVKLSPEAEEEVNELLNQLVSEHHQSSPLSSIDQVADRNRSRSEADTDLSITACERHNAQHHKHDMGDR